MKKYISALIFTIILYSISFSQVSLVHLEDIQGNFNDKNDNLVVPKYSITFDQDMKLYHKDSLMFSPKDKFEDVIHQVFNNRFWVISTYTPSHSAIIREARVKSNVIIIDTEKWDKLYYFDLKGSVIINIYKTDESVVINAVEPKNIKTFSPKKAG